MTIDLASRRCAPCDGETAALTAEAAGALLAHVPAWALRPAAPAGAPMALTRRFTFRDFRRAMAFVGAMAGLAEDQGHHPDFTVRYNRVEVEIWTHAIRGLSENDFILAARIDQLPEGRA